MKAVVVGGAGFIGSNIVDQLIDRGDQVLIVDSFITGLKENVNPKATLVEFDVANQDHKELRKILEGYEAVYHTAALPRVEPSIIDPVTSNNINVTGTVNVFTACRDAKIKNVIFSSSSSVYGNAKNIPTSEIEQTEPMSPYALQKLIGEQYAKLFCKLYNMNITCLRYFNVYGKRQPTEGAYVPVVGIWFRQKESGEPMTITGDGTQTRDFVNVEDVAAANILCVDRDLKGYNVLNVGFGENHKLVDLIKLCGENYTHIAPRIEPHTTLADISFLKFLGWSPKIEVRQWISKNKPKVK